MLLRLVLMGWVLQSSTVAWASTGTAPGAETVPRREAGRKAAAAQPAEAPVPLPVDDDVLDGIWDWLERLDGEVLPERVAAEVETDVEARIAEQAFTRPDGGVDVPLDYYADPTRALQGDPLFLDRLDLSEFDIPIVMHDAVISRLRLFLGPHRKYIQTWLDRKSRYEPMILAELEKAGMPRDVIYLSMIESGFNPYAYSSAAAAGLWQFIPATGAHYGLDQDWWVDERRDPEMATKAAVKMLGELHRMFGDWHLAFAAYNTGPGRVKRLVEAAKAAGRPATYWDFLERKELHPETAGYVPKIIAAAIIGHNPQRYGFTVNKSEPLEYDTVTVAGAVDLEVLAKCAGLDDEGFRLLNPIFRRYASPEGTSVIRVPKGAGASFEEALAKVPPSERLLLVKHMVRRGETLSIIAGRYGVSSSELARVNGIHNPNLIAVGQWIVVPRRGDASSSSTITAVMETRPAGGEASAAAAPAAVPTATTVRKSYTVRSGDTLSGVAAKYGLRMSDLQRWNRIPRSGTIYVGQKLTYYVTVKSTSASTSSTTKAPAPAPSSSSSSKAPASYTVRSGDTLSVIAARYGLGLSDVQSWNGIRNASDIRVGQVLRLTKPSGSTATPSAEPAGTWISHTVRSGESLGLIAEKYGVTVSDLRSWNRISGSTIYAGQKLKVKKD